LHGTALKIPWTAKGKRERTKEGTVDEDTICKGSADEGSEAIRPRNANSC